MVTPLSRGGSSPLNMSARILVVDDDKEIVRLLKSYLTQEGLTVFTALDGAEALHILRRERPDLVVLDLMLPGRDGWEVTRRMRADEQLAAIPILMLTARVEDDDKIRGLELGADDYVTKPFNPKEVVARVRAILRRSASPGRVAPILRVRGLRLDRAQHAAEIDERPLDLTPTEFALLRTFLENPSHAFTRGELIEKALGYDHEGLERTLDSHIKNLRRKIEADPAQPQYIETVFGVGYRMRVEDSPSSAPRRGTLEASSPPAEDSPSSTPRRGTLEASSPPAEDDAAR
jgi:two-component system alkaline phosphatase synthesis response regulator PhoP